MRKRSKSLRSRCALEYSAAQHMVTGMRKLILLIISLGSLLQAQESHMVVEAYSGKILSATDAGTKRPVASLTKIAMAIVTVDWAGATETDLATKLITVPQSAASLGNSSSVGLRVGDSITMRDALYASLLASDNVAAHAIAHHVGQSLLSFRGESGNPMEAFIKEMNQLADAIFAQNTRFTNPHGLNIGKKPGYSTAADIARFSIHAMRRNAITFITRQKSREIVISGTQKTITNTNQLAGELGILGIKTGTTNAAGACLATCMDRDPLIREKRDGSKGVTPRRLIVVVLNSQDRFARTRKLLKDGWVYYDAWIASGAPVNKPKREILTTTKPQ